MPYLRHKELTHIINKINPRAIIIPGIYRKFNYLEMVEELKKEHPDLKYTFLLDESIPGPYPENTFSLMEIAKEPWEEKKARTSPLCQAVPGARGLREPYTRNAER